MVREGPLHAASGGAPRFLDKTPDGLDICMATARKKAPPKDRPDEPIEAWPAERKLKTTKGLFTLTYTLVDNEAALARMTQVVSDAPVFSWDTETSGLVPALGARVVGHAFAVKLSPRTAEAFYVPIRHVGPVNAGVPQLSAERVSDALRTIFSTPGRVWAHHGKFDAKMARADDVLVYKGNREFADTMLAATIDNENEESFGLKPLSSKYVTPDAATEETKLTDWLRVDARIMKLPFRKDQKKPNGTVLRSYMNRFGYARSPVNLLGVYACHDVFYTLFLGENNYARTKDNFPALWEREHRMAKLISELEWRGLPVNASEIARVYERTKEESEFWLEQIRTIVGDPEFAPTPAALRKLFLSYGMESPKPTKTGLFAVDKESRRLLSHSHPEHAKLFHALNTYAVSEKLHSTYALSYLRYYSSITSSVHPSYNQIERRAEGGVPVTGRLSSADPNAQNVAGQKAHLRRCGCDVCVKERKAEPGPEDTISIRRYFTVPEGHVRAYLDFSQIELRVLAWLCQDPVMLKAYRDGVDIHQVVADELGIDRKVAKQVNFGNSYGMSAMGLSKRLPSYYSNPEGALAEAETVLAAYFERFYRILEFRKELAKDVAKRGGYLINVFGRPRRIPDIAHNEAKIRDRCERQMMSSIVSGTAADLMKESALRCEQTLLASDIPGALVQTVHDELVFDIEKRPGWTRLLKQLVHDMTYWPLFSHPPDKVGVPIEVNVALSTTTWENKREIKFEGEKIRWA